ncbi:uncharacterized protein LOC128679923 isoform X1 [Plodia interpunctella]|uniref:uncharacterized protein LOC128679923 isoform X1 n=1 Tax=Plodia interpunctella TaxID=58824 RepID=UPI002367CD95|nr:uncharacterized protein LOC128679923 isoform X1 [Plodia interpunctella]XP_053618409.1 uncharacterized protein LOC128679923 isoform X1 [Plodia interpunctella]XP_053618410.1 uncharacterized protein LOC128679923 isoform X1 [Plodia interpunctella]
MRSLLAYYAEAVMTAAARGAGCALGCSGRGDCMNGTCLCEIRYAGDECAAPNLPYHACIGGVFLLVAFVCAVQLTICVVTEYRRLKAPTFLRACKVTTQKMLYLVAFLASLIRGAYFVSPSAFQEGWATSLLSAYYPLLMSGSSLIVCFWAEVFHLRDIRWERPRFLSKSFLAFVTFNVISYSLLAAEVLTTNVANTSAEKKSFYQHVFNGCYAVLLFIVVIFFLIYGVEVYFKLRGEFVKETKVCTIISPRAGPSTAAEGDDVQDTLVTKQGIQTDLTDSDGTIDPRSVNQSQLQQSRVGLVSQALMLILIAGFLASETLSEFWKAKVPVVSRNWHDLVFRLAEIGVALWFPCVLWNSMAPERLWILNPRRLLARQLDDAKLSDLLQHHRDAKTLVLFWRVPLVEKASLFFAVVSYWRWLLMRVVLVTVFRPLPLDNVQVPNVETDSLVGSVGSGRDCWICYDGSRPEPLIRPCRCTGDVSAVHHDCLRRWLVESAATPDGLKCKVCNTPYIVQETNRVEWERGFTCAHWARTALAVACTCGAGAAAWLLVQLFQSPVVRVLAAGAALLVCYVAVRFLGSNTVTAYQRAKVSSLRILTEPLDQPEQGLSTISKTVTVDITAKSVLDRALKGEEK